MNKFVDELSDRINELYKVYENYIWKKDGRRLAIVFQNNMILTFYLFENNELVDELHLSFDKNEYNLFRAVCLRTFVMALGNVLVHKLDSEDVYYNDKRKPYLAVISKSDSITEIIDIMLETQETEIINKNNRMIQTLEKNIKRKVYNKQFLKELDTRIKLSDELLKR